MKIWPSYLDMMLKVLLFVFLQWKSSRSDIEDQGTAVLDALMRGTHMADHGEVDMPTLQVMDKLYEMLENSYDEEYGGFGKAPKFPQPGEAVKVESSTTTKLSCVLFCCEVL